MATTLSLALSVIACVWSAVLFSRRRRPSEWGSFSFGFCLCGLLWACSFAVIEYRQREARDEYLQSVVETVVEMVYAEANQPAGEAR